MKTSFYKLYNEKENDLTKAYQLEDQHITVNTFV